MYAETTIPTLCRKGALLALAALLSACTTTTVRAPDVAQHGGYVLHDENTTPRFRHLGRPTDDVIGTLYPDGSNVFLDGRRVDDDTSIRNGAHVRTGPDSLALVALVQATRGPCQIEVLEILQGRILGNTAECQHTLDTPQGIGEAETRRTEYHAGVSGTTTELTVISGRMLVRLKSDPARAVIANRFQEVVLTPETIIGPRPVTQADIDRRTRWSRNFEFSQQSLNSGAIIGGAAAGALLWYLLDRADDDDNGAGDGPSRDDVGSPPPETEYVRVPNVVENSLADAIAAIKRGGLAVGRITGPTGGDDRRVVNQLPNAGTRVPEGTRVDLEVQPVIY